MQYTHITEAQAAEMQKTVADRSQSFVEFAHAAAKVMGDALAEKLYGDELDRRWCIAEFRRLHSLDAVVVGGENL